MDVNSEDTSSLSSEEEKDGDAAPLVNGTSGKVGWSSAFVNKALPSKDTGEEDCEEEEGTSLPTIFFFHTVEPKKVRRCTEQKIQSDLAISSASQTPFSSGQNKYRKKHNVEVQ